MLTDTTMAMLSTDLSLAIVERPIELRQQEAVALSARIDDEPLEEAETPDIFNH